MWTQLRDISPYLLLHIFLRLQQHIKKYEQSIIDKKIILPRSVRRVKNPMVSRNSSGPDSETVFITAQSKMAAHSKQVSFEVTFIKDVISVHLVWRPYVPCIIRGYVIKKKQFHANHKGQFIMQMPISLASRMAKLRPPGHHSSLKTNSMPNTLQFQ